MVVEGIVKLRPLYAARRKMPGAALRPLVWVLSGFTTNGSTSGPIDRKRPHGRRKVPIGGILVANSRVNERRGREGRRCSSGWGTATSVAERVPEQRAPGEGGGWERGRRRRKDVGSGRGRDPHVSGSHFFNLIYLCGSVCFNDAGGREAGCGGWLTAGEEGECGGRLTAGEERGAAGGIKLPRKRHVNAMYDEDLVKEATSTPRQQKPVVPGFATKGRKSDWATNRETQSELIPPRAPGIGAHRKERGGSAGRVGWAVLGQEGDGPIEEEKGILAQKQIEVIFEFWKIFEEGSLNPN
uniref:OSJNBb0056F09.2 protein n=1 Tax=Oryza sativa subsp. japonica TaxID=39947 RepID=Q7FB02_ORYSJ|nr:OSJNBb0056F09.2 [Oryza sativa Japonica Group]